MKQIQENGITYKLNDEGIIVEANKSTDLPESQTSLEPCVPGDSVTADGKLGKVVAVTDTVYGEVVAVQHDDGSLGEYAAADVEHAEETPQVFSSDVEEIRARYVAYEGLPSITTEEINVKASEARLLKLRAEAGLRKSNLDMQETLELDSIAMVTSTDLKDLKDLKIDVDRAENENYLRGAGRKYRTADEVGSYAPNMGMSGEDASWLDTAIDGMVVSEATDADLATTALHMVAKLDREQLTNDDTVQTATGFQKDYLGIANDIEKTAKFEAFVEEARQEELAKPEIVKEASEESLDDFNTAALYL